MQHFKHIGHISLLFGLMSSSALAQPVARPLPHSGQVATVKQDESITFVNESAVRDITARQDLKAGDVLKTNAKGAMSIVFADKTQIRLARNTTLLVKKVAAGSPSEIELTQGAVWGRSPRGRSRLTVKTPAATAAIRGTEWSLTVQGSQTQLQVASGRVEISNPQGQLEITGGQGASAITGQAPVRVIVTNRGTREQMLYYLTPSQIHGTLPPGSALSLAHEAAFAGEFETATRVLKPLLSAGSPEAHVFWLDAKIGFLIGDDPRIEKTLKAGLSAYPDDPDLQILYAEFQSAYLGRPDLALHTARRMSETHPSHAQGHLVLSKILLERRADLEALSEINQAIAIRPDAPEFYVHQADIYLRQNRPRKAETALKKAFKLAPNLSIARLGYGQIEALSGDDDAALKETLAASAGNPSYALALLRLAEIYGRQGEEALAEQQLDAADRLDPHTPFTPLYRTSLALHHYEAHDAIDGAQEALTRFKARGGIYENLSENRESGSNISRAFRFQNLEAWGRYYGDRTFDSFTATSYFDQTLNEQPGPFFIRREDTSFNPQNGDDPDQISTYLQGVILDPLSVAQSERRLQISKEHFAEGSLGMTSIQSGTSELLRAGAGFQAQTALGSGGAEIPLALNIKARRTHIIEDTVDRAATNGGVDLVDETLDTDFIEAYFGSQPGSRDKITAFARYRTQEKTIRESPGFLLAPNDQILEDTETSEGFVFWTHGFSDFHTLVIGAGKRRAKEISSIIGPNDPRPSSGGIINTSDLIFTSWSKRFGDIDLKIGGESFWNARELANTTSGRNEARGYVSAVYNVKDTVRLSGKAGVLKLFSDQASGIASDKTNFEYDFGAAVEPAPGQWLRLSASQRTEIRTPFTLAPTASLGLKGALVPVSEGEQIKSLIARWDRQWSNRLFTSIEFQDQRFGLLAYDTPDGRQRASVNEGKLQHLTSSVNYHFGNNWAAEFDYSRVWSEGDRGARTGDPLPFVPKQTANISLTWTHPKRISVTYRGAYIGEQESAVFNFTNGPGVLIDDYFTSDLEARWEPYGKRFELRLGLINLFNNDFEVTENVPAPGRSVLASIQARF